MRKQKQIYRSKTKNKFTFHSNISILEQKYKIKEIRELSELRPDKIYCVLT